jgi:hypothetical protein
MITHSKRFFCARRAHSKSRIIEAQLKTHSVVFTTAPLSPMSAGQNKLAEPASCGPVRTTQREQNLGF